MPYLGGMKTHVPTGTLQSLVNVFNSGCNSRKQSAKLFRESSTAKEHLASARELEVEASAYEVCASLLFSHITTLKTEVPADGDTPITSATWDKAQADDDVADSGVVMRDLAAEFETRLAKMESLSLMLLAELKISNPDAPAVLAWENAQNPCIIGA